MELHPQTDGTVSVVPHSAPLGTRAALGLIFFIMLMDVIGITILSPVTPYIVRRFSDDALMVTLMTVIYAGAQFFAAPLLGKLGDRHGRLPVLLWSVLGSAVGYVIFGLGGALWILFISRLIDGVSGGNMATASAYVADVSTPENRARNFTLIGLAWAVGLVVGPALGSVFGQISLEAPAFVAAGLSLLSVILGYFLLPESLPKEKRQTAPIRINDLNPFSAIGTMWRKIGLGRLLLVLCLFNFAFNGINSTQTLFMIDKFNAQTSEVGLLLVLIGVAIAGVQAVVGRLVARYGEKRLATASLLGLGAVYTAVFVAPTLWLLYPLIILANAVSGFVFPALGSLTVNRVSPGEIGVLMGVTTALASLMSVFGPLWAGSVYDAVMLGAPFWMGAVIFVVAAVILGRVNDTALLRDHEGKNPGRRSDQSIGLQ